MLDNSVCIPNFNSFHECTASDFRSSIPARQAVTAALNAAMMRRAKGQSAHASSTVPVAPVLQKRKKTVLEKEPGFVQKCWATKPLEFS